jgi:hypothetical protein
MRRLIERHEYLRPHALHKVFLPRAPVRHSGDSFVPHSMQRYSRGFAFFRFLIWHGLVVHDPVFLIVSKREAVICIPMSPEPGSFTNFGTAPSWGSPLLFKAECSIACRRNSSEECPLFGWRWTWRSVSQAQEDMNSTDLVVRLCDTCEVNISLLHHFLLFFIFFVRYLCFCTKQLELFDKAGVGCVMVKI